MTVSTRDKRSSGSVVYKVRNDGSPTESVFTFPSPAHLGNYQKIDSVRSGNFTPGIFRVNPVTIEKSTGVASSSSREVIWPMGATGYKKWEGNFSLFGLGYGFENRDLNYYDYQARLASASLAKAYANATALDLSLATDLAELSETIAMIRDPVRSFVKMLRTPTEWRSISNMANAVSKKANAAAYADQTASSWLLFRYGLTPLARQIEGYIEYANKILERIEVGKLRRSKGSAKMSGSVSWTKKSVSTPFNIRLDFQGSISYKVKTTSSVYYTYTGIPSAQAMLGLSVWDIPEAVWERLYLSFVWDWFIGIGDWISGLEFNLYRDLVGACTSYRVTEVIVVQCTKATSNTGIVYNTPSDTSMLTTERLIRVVNPHSSMPLVPVVNLNLDLLRGLDSLALIWQRLPRKWR